MRLVPVLVLAASLPALPACSSIETVHRDWSQYEGPGAQHFQIEELPLPEAMRDPLQPMNRELFDLNDVFMDWVMRPVGAVWRFVFPRTVREHIAKAGTNLGFPARALNDLAQGEPGAAGIETLRFLINTTVGLLGFFDPATSFGLEAPRSEDTGQTLHKAGWDDPTYLFVPLVGPSSSRDLVGQVGDWLGHIATWIGGFVVPGVLAVNRGSDAVIGYEHLVNTEPDPYELARLAWTVLRAAQFGNYPVRWAEDGEGKQALMAVFLAPKDEYFRSTGDSARVVLPATGLPLEFDYWLQDERAPVLYIVPGVGSHRLSDHALALAEAALEAGWSAVTISSVFHPEFAASSSAPVPGFAPADARAVFDALDAVDHWLVQHHGEQLGERVLAGLSMGAFHVLYIAAEQQRLREAGSPAPLEFSLIGALDPPVSLAFAAGQLDAYYRTPMSWPEGERADRINATLKKVAAFANGDLTPGAPLPFGEDEARYLIGLAMRITLRNAIWESQGRLDQGVLLTPRDPERREPAYREIEAYSYMEYVYAFVLPWLQRTGLAADEHAAFEACDLHAIAPLLKRCEFVRVFSSPEDFLRRREDDQFLRDTLDGGRFTGLDEGGHLGNVWRPDVRVRVLTQLRTDLAKLPTPAPPTPDPEPAAP